MKIISNSKQYFNLKKALLYTLAFILSMVCLRNDVIQQAIGSELQDEPHISLKVKNQPLRDVLKTITLDTGFKIKLNDQWGDYPVNASIENIPLHRGLSFVLKGLNHVIIYESDKSIKIVVYGEADSRITDSPSIQQSSTQIQNNQQEHDYSSESSPEVTNDLKHADDSSE